MLTQILWVFCIVATAITLAWLMWAALDFFNQETKPRDGDGPCHHRAAIDR